MSDLQQSDLDIAYKCLSTATEDFKSLELECDQIWNLGDTIQGTDLETIEKMVDMQIELLQPFDIPLKFTCGNHEFDPCLAKFNNKTFGGKEKIKVFSYEKFSEVPNWKTSDSISDFYFTDKLGEITLFFFPDHAHPNGEWATAGGVVHGESRAYPHSESAYLAVNKAISEIKGPVITAGHASFDGGLRPSDLMNQMLPLPSNVIAHFHGHSHIGDKAWGGPSCFRKLSTVAHQDIPQFDIAALENNRGDAIRSAILEIYEDLSIGVLFREHDHKKWSDAYYIANKSL